MALSIVRGRDADELVRSAGFLSQWTQLHETCPWATAFQSPPYVTTWYESYEHRYSPVVAVEFSPAGDLVGLIPLAMESDSGKLTLAGAHQAEYKAWLAPPSNGESFMERALTKLARETDISALFFQYLPPGTPTDWIKRSRGMPWTCELEAHPRPIIPVGDAAAVTDYLRKKMSRKSTRNYWNRLKKPGNLRLEQIREPDQLTPIFDQLIVYYDIRQGGIHGKFEFERDLAKKPFHLALLRTPGLLHVTILKAGEEIISAWFGVTHRKTYSGAMPMFSPFYASDSPMTVHLLMLVEQLHQEGFSVLDLTPGPDAFKDRFAADYDSAHALSIYFRQRIKYKVMRGSETLAKRTLRSLRITPGSALEHWRQLARVPLRTWPSVLARELPALLRGPRSTTEWRIYVIDSKNVAALEHPGRMSRDRLADLLAFQPSEFWRTRQKFTAESLKRIENGHHFYTGVEYGRLVHCSWLAENKKMDVFPGTRQPFHPPPGSAILYGSYTDPAARGRGLYHAALDQMLYDAAQLPGINYIFTAAQARNKLACRVIEKLGFIDLRQQPSGTPPKRDRE
jgi:CelD/BcsL family acetyltransferase involved in cellulose biosynthesis/RimJ/RimL family protein N-acetyltransferase